MFDIHYLQCFHGDCHHVDVVYIWGNQIGAKFWEVVADEHGIDPTGNSAFMRQQIKTLSDINDFS